MSTVTGVCARNDQTDVYSIFESYIRLDMKSIYKNSMDPSYEGYEWVEFELRDNFILFARTRMYNVKEKLFTMFDIILMNPTNRWFTIYKKEDSWKLDHDLLVFRLMDQFKVSLSQKILNAI